jgi:hypothetical protein
MVRQRRSRTPNFVPGVAACATEAGELTARLYEGLSVSALTNRKLGVAVWTSNRVEIFLKEQSKSDNVEEV